MAHKTFSQEQFIIKFYRFVISFSTTNTFGNPKSVNESLFLLISLRLSIPVLETNLLFLKRFRLQFLSSDKKFMTLID
jgi:hypothetical protein